MFRTITDGSLSRRSRETTWGMCEVRRFNSLFLQFTQWLKNPLKPHYTATAIAIFAHFWWVAGSCLLSDFPGSSPEMSYRCSDSIFTQEKACLRSLLNSSKKSLLPECFSDSSRFLLRSRHLSLSHILTCFFFFTPPQLVHPSKIPWPRFRLSDRDDW